MWEKIKNSIIFNVVIVVLAVFLAVSASRTMRQAFLVREEVEKEKEKIEELQKKKTELEAYLLELETKDAIEREAKQELNLKLPGEEVVVVVPEKNGVSFASPPRLTVWERIKLWFDIRLVP